MNRIKLEWKILRIDVEIQYFLNEVMMIKFQPKPIKFQNRFNSAGRIIMINQEKLSLFLPRKKLLP
jgi:hypothetical protein